MKSKCFIVLTCAVVIFSCGCAEKRAPGTSKVDERVVMGESVGSSGAATNPILTPFRKVISALKGEGLKVNEVILRVNDKDLLEVQVKGYNQSFKTKKFQYRFIWLDEEGFEIPTRSSVWKLGSAVAKNNFTIKEVAPSEKAADFNLITRDEF
jgi:hypothetical protein